MAIPKVSIVGRPNVGKSSIFNWLTGQRIAIVDPTAGVTRDRISFLLEHAGRYLELTDTGGMGIDDRDGLTEDVERQIQHALDEADLILFVLDAQTGLMPLDTHVARRLRQLDRPVLAVANKCDNPKFRLQAEAEFHRLGWPLCFVSTVHGINREELIEAVIPRLPANDGAVAPDIHMKLAVVGKRNAGKSTFINHLAQAERVIVSEVPGTTRDSVDVHFDYNGKHFVAIDTAGVRRARSVQDSIDFYSLSRAQRTIRRADVVLFFIDALEPLGKVDQQLAQYITDHHKPCVLAINKWDLVKDVATETFSEYVDRLLLGLKFAPRAFITAKTGKNASALVDVCLGLFKQTNTHVGTAEINRVFEDALARRSPPLRENRTPRIYYATQAAVAPPTLVVFCNGPRLFDKQYQRYLLNHCREHLPFAEVPIRLLFRQRGERASARLDEAPGDFGQSSNDTASSAG